MKKRRLLSALLAASLLCTMAPPATVLAAEANTETVDEQNSTSRGALTVTGGQEGTDYEWDNGVLVIKSEKTMTLSDRGDRYPIRVVPGINATLNLEEVYVEIDAIPEDSRLSLTFDDNKANRVCYLSDYEGALEITGRGSCSVETLNRDAKSFGNLYINCDNQVGNIGINIDESWSFKEFVINSGRVYLYYYLDNRVEPNSQYEPNISAKKFEIHGGYVDFRLDMMIDYYDAISSDICTIDGGAISVSDYTVDKDDRPFFGIVGGDSEFGEVNVYTYNPLIRANTYNITGGEFYSASLSYNTVYGCPINKECTLEVQQAGVEDLHGTKYAKYVVVSKDSPRLSVSGDDYTASGRVVTLGNGTYTVSSQDLTNDCIVIEDGASTTLHLNGVKICNTQPAITVGYNSHLTLVLQDGTDNSVSTIGELGHAAIETQTNSELIIRGSGDLYAQGTAGGAGIGGGEIYSSSASIKIEGGNIIAQGGDIASGIGGGFESSYMEIEITGGELEASGVSGIGDGPHSKGTFITVTGGDITANGNDGAGIGGGPGSIVRGINIENGTIDASSINGAGIGSGSGYYSSNTQKACNATIDRITISGGHVYADGSAGIGGGRMMNSALTSVDEIILNGGTIEARGRSYSIGAGQGGIGGTLSCTGAVIIADSISDMAHQGSWNGLFFVNTINDGEGTLLGNYVSLGNDSIVERSFKIKNGQQLYIPENVTLTNLGRIDVQAGGSLINEGSLDNEEGHITVYPEGFFENNGELLGTVDYIEEEPNYDDMYVTGVQLSKERMTLQPEKSKKLTATVLPETAENKNVTWSSSDTNVAK